MQRRPARTQVQSCARKASYPHPPPSHSAVVTWLVNVTTHEGRSCFSWAICALSIATCTRSLLASLSKSSHSLFAVRYIWARDRRGERVEKRKENTTSKRWRRGKQMETRETSTPIGTGSASYLWTPSYPSPSSAPHSIPQSSAGAPARIKYTRTEYALYSSTSSRLKVSQRSGHKDP